MSIVDAYSFHGCYVSKHNPVVPARTAREIEKMYDDMVVKYNVAQGRIDRAHAELNNMGVDSRIHHFPLSLAGRIRKMK